MSGSMEMQETAGHVLANLDEGRFVVDTGSPTSFARGGKISFAGKTADVSTSAMGMLDADELSGYVGVKLDGMIGMDILGDYRLSFVGNRLLVDDVNAPEDGFVALPTDSFLGIPVVTIGVNGRDVKAFVDTGAKTSYLNPDLLAGLPVEETVHDFYPGVGEFDVDVSLASCVLNGLPLKARFGRLPDLLQMTLMMGGVDGILGHDLFSAYDVRIDHGRTVAIRPRLK